MLRKFVVLVFESAVSAVLLVFALIGIWVLFGVHWHMLPVIDGKFGVHGCVELGVPIKTKILEFSAIRIPSRVVARVFVIPEEIEVTVKYLDGESAVRIWEHTYLIACNASGTCMPTSSVRTINFYSNGVLFDKAWLYFPIVKIPAIRALPSPKLLPPKKPPRYLGVLIANTKYYKTLALFIRAGAFYLVQ